MKDQTNIWRDTDDVALTATEAAITGIDIGPAGSVGHRAIVHVPEADRTTGDETLTVTWQESDAVGGTYRTFATMPVITAVGDYAIVLNNRQRFVRPVLTVAGTTPDFGIVVVALDGAGFPNDLQTGDNL